MLFFEEEYFLWLWGEIYDYFFIFFCQSTEWVFKGILEERRGMYAFLRNIVKENVRVLHEYVRMVSLLYVSEVV